MHEGHRERMRKRYLLDGADSFEDHELLELLLFYGIPRKNTNTEGHNLLEYFGTFSNIFEAPIDEIKKVEGIGENSAILIKLIPDIYRRIKKDKALPKPRIDSVETAGKFLIAHYTGILNENVTLICLDNKGNIKDISTISYGSVSQVAINSRVLLQTAIKFNAVSAIIAHNHPQSIELPSFEDIESTVKIKSILDEIDVSLLDHIIVSGENYLSMASSREYSYIFR